MIHPLVLHQKVLQWIRLLEMEENFDKGTGIEERKSYIAPNRDRFLKKKIPTDLDAIIIGSGIGGLSCAAFLSRVGKRCLVIEQHYIAGGCTHSFVEHGYEFDTGVHYVGNIEKRRENSRFNY